jgi:hypothetical protein
LNRKQDKAIERTGVYHGQEMCYLWQGADGGKPRKPRAQFEQTALDAQFAKTAYFIGWIA